jgi:hypothetical protein
MMAAMEAIDPERERIRLAELYSGMTIEQLEELAEEWEFLTGAAQTALKQEVGRRGLILEFEDEPPPDAAQDSVEFVTIREFDSTATALLAKQYLETGGIKGRLVDAFDRPLEPMQNSLNVSLQVSKEDAESAIAILDAPVTLDPESDE